MSKELSIYQKLNNFRMAVEGLRKDKKGYGYKYADINQVIKVITEPLSNVGLIDVDTIETDENGIMWLRTDLVDIDNPENKLSIKTPLLLKDPNNPQALGSALTYNRRYNRVTLLGLEQEDDDGEKAKQPPENKNNAKVKNYPEPKNTNQKSSNIKKYFWEVVAKKGLAKDKWEDFGKWLINAGINIESDDEKEKLLKQDIRLKKLITHYLEELKAVEAMGG